MKHLSLKKHQSPVARQAAARLLSLPLLGALLLSVLFLASWARADISEPETIFYGKVINRTSGQEDLLTQGNLVWTLSGTDGRQLTLTATLQPINGGIYSYQLLVPHEALNYGLTVSSNSIPLPPLPVIYTHLQITVDGAPASLMAPGSSDFAVAQSLRASTYRLDLELTNSLPSTSGDGIPDWWKAKFGLVDPNADPDGDGWTNLQEFLHGSNPNQDNRTPTLDTTELFVYADGTTGIRLHATDLDSAPTNLFYSLLTVPQGGTLYLRNSSATGTNSAAALAVGAAFTQDDMDKGRLIFVQQDTNNPALPASLSVSLHDENPNHAVTNAFVALNVYRPTYPYATMQLAEAIANSAAGYTALAGLSADEQQMVMNYFLSHDQGYVIWDASRAAAPQTITVPSSGLTSAQYSQYITAYGHDRRHVLVGGSGNDRLVGGMENDIIVGGRGNDTMRGNGGSDLFVITSGGNDTIEDFNLGENDAIDISRILLGSSSLITNYVQIINSGTNSYLGVNFNGTGAGFTNLVLTLLGTHLSQNDLGSLVDNGNLITGNKVFAPRVSIVASIPGASQNGPVAGQFTFTRTGGTDSALAVNLQITGSAVNGSDYQFIASQAIFPAGQKSVTLAITPYPNSTVVTQVVQVAVLTGSGYELGTNTLAQVTIEPLSPQISIQALEPVAIQSDQTSGLFLVTRGGILDRSVLVRLTIAGTAPNGSHYTSVSPFINFASQQTTALIAITPKTGVVISNGLEYVQISIKPDPSYKVMDPSTDRVLLISQMFTLSQWQQKYFPTATEDSATFAAEDTGHTGIRNLFRYAFGLNPQSPQGSKGLPAGQVLNDHLTLSFQQPVAVSDINYVVEVSNDLVSWSSGAADVEQFFPPTTTNTLQTVSFRSKSSVSGNQKQFMRVRVVPQ